MNKKNHIRGKQNKGFTLVEVLIAITILAIIVAPLLHAFVTASRTNAKAKQLMKATTLAQNVMEEMKANSLEDVARQFNSSATTSYTSNLSIAGLAESLDKAYEAIETAEGYVAATTSENEVVGSQPANSSIRTSTAPEGDFVGQTSGEYHFMLENVARESAKFDIAVHLTKNAANGTHNLTSVNAMNEPECGYYEQSLSDENAIVQFDTAIRAYPNSLGTLTQTEIREAMTRIITIDIASVSGNETVKITYDYEIPSGYTQEQDRYYSESVTIFDNYLSGDELKAVYLYYKPLYEGVGRDNIKVVNNSNLDVDVYLIKVKGEGYSEYNDTNYTPTINVLETAANASGQSNTLLCTNITKTTDFRYSVLGSTLRFTDLGNEQSTDCFYDVKIDVYKHSDTPFQEDNRITSFTGSMMDNSR